MSKAILVMDMPSSCLFCPCSNLIFQQKCEETGEYITLDNIYEERPTWCPLRECPTKKEDNSVIYLERYEGYLEGWNDCVNEILGGGE